MKTMTLNTIAIAAILASLNAFSAPASQAHDSKEAQAKAQSKKLMNITLSTLNIQGTMLQSDFQVSERTTVGPILGAGLRGAAFGGSVNYMFSEGAFQSGWSVNSQFISSKMGSTIGALAQRNWYFDSGFNLNAGLGLEHVDLKLIEDGSLNIKGIIPKLGFNLGYVF